MRSTRRPFPRILRRVQVRTFLQVVFLLVISGCEDAHGNAGDAAGGADASDAGQIEDSGRADAATGSDAATSTDAATTSDTGQADAGSSAEPPGLVGTTASHNTARANVSPPRTAGPIAPLTWSTTLATAAQTWASGCTYGHSGNGYGENVYATTGSGGTGTAAVANWVSESAMYTYATNACSGECGHYTQVVWNATTSVGCGLAVCNTNSPFDVSEYGPIWTLIVCDYSPPGNSGGRPY